MALKQDNCKCLIRALSETSKIFCIGLELATAVVSFTELSPQCDAALSLSATPPLPSALIYRSLDFFKSFFQLSNLPSFV